MSQNNFSYPYPVLTCGGDDLLPALIRDNVVVGVPQKDDNGDYFLSVALIMENEGLLSDINNGNAEFVIEVDCPTTHYRCCEKSTTNQFNIKLPGKSVAGRVSFQPYLIAKRDFNYSNSNFHPDYGGATFDIELGDVLVIFNAFRYDFDIEYANLRAYSSIMTIRQAPEGQEEIRYKSDEDKIVVELPVKKFEQYQQFRTDPQYAPSIHASIVQNALLTVLLQEDWSNPDDEDYLWKRTIRYRVDHEEELKPYKDLSDKENLVQLAQKILRDPVQRMFDNIMANMTKED